MFWVEISALRVFPLKTIYMENPYIFCFFVFYFWETEDIFGYCFFTYVITPNEDKKFSMKKVNKGEEVTNDFMMEWKFFFFFLVVEGFYYFILFFEKEPHKKLARALLTFFFFHWLLHLPSTPRTNKQSLRGKGREEDEFLEEERDSNFEQLPRSDLEHISILSLDKIEMCSKSLLGSSIDFRVEGGEPRGGVSSEERGRREG